MSKKVISILLSAAMLVAMMCVGFGAVTAAAEDGDFTYYFLAPDSYCNPEKGAANTDVGIYWWSGPADRKPAAWPGFTMEAAPEVGPNVYKASVPDNDNVNAIVINAFVDAGTPADPELAKVAHQTSDIDVEADDYNGMIYVLAMDDAHMSVNPLSEAVTCSGDWFKLDEYKTSYNYSTYGFDAAPSDTDKPADTDVPADTDKPADTDVPADTTKQYHKDDVVTVTYKIGGLDKAAALNSAIKYNPEFVAVDLTYGDQSDPELMGFTIENEKFTEAVVVNTKFADDAVGLGGTLSARGVNDFAGDPAALVVVKFKAVKDFNVGDLGIDVETTKLVHVVDGQPTEVTADAGKYISIDTAIECNHTPVDSDKPVVVDTDTTSDKPVATDTDSGKEKPPVVNTDSDKKESGDTPSSDKKDSSTKKTTTSTSTTGTAATVQTAGTFTVIALVVILMAAAGVVLYTRKKTEE